MNRNDVSRISFLKTVGMGSLAAMGAGVIPSETLSAIKNPYINTWINFFLSRHVTVYSVINESCIIGKRK